MGSAASVKNYCEEICCPEDSTLFNSYYKDNSYLNKEKEKDNPNNSNITFDKNNKNYNKKLINLIMNNDDNNYNNNSKINIEEEEKDKENITNINNINFSFIDNSILNINDNNKEKINDKIELKKSEMIISNLSNEFTKVNSKIKSILKNKTSTIKSNNNNSKNKTVLKKNRIIDFDNDSDMKSIQNKNKTFINTKKKSKIKVNFEKKKKNNKKDIAIQFNDDVLSESKINKNKSSYLLSTLLKDIELVNVSEESFRSLTLKSSKLQNQMSKLSLRHPMDNDYIKGNFLLKKMKFKYEGDKDQEGKKVGFGIILYEDTSKIMGYFYNSKLNGIVCFYNCGLDNSTFVGEYTDNIPDGYGLYTRQGLKLEGMNWNKNFINDIGIAVWDEGDFYQGEFKNNLKNGIGTYRWPDGTNYQGYFKNNQIDGYGEINFSNGNSYIGEFNEGYLSGWGKFIWEDKKCYIGNYKENKKNGFGIFIWNYDPLLALVGFWEKGVQIGFCIKLLKGYIKYIFVQDSKKNIEISSKGDICRYLKPSQMKYKNLFKKSYHQLEHFIKSFNEW